MGSELPLLSTKFAIPLITAEFVPRPRLIERLNESTHGPLTVLSAPAPKPPAVGSGLVDWAVALPAAQAAFPEARIRTAGLPPEPGKPASVRLRQPGEWHPNGRTVALIDPATNRVVQTVDGVRRVVVIS